MNYIKVIVAKFAQYKASTVKKHQTPIRDLYFKIFEANAVCQQLSGFGISC